MRFSIKMLTIVTIVTLAGCGLSVPECSDSDAKELAIDIVESNEGVDVLQTIEGYIDHYRRQASELEPNVETIEKREAEFIERDAKIAKLQKQTEKLNTLVGLPVGTCSSYSSTFEKRGWEHTNYGSWQEAYSDFLFRHNLGQDLSELNSLVGLPVGNLDKEKFKKIAVKRGWEGTKYPNSHVAWEDYRRLCREISDLLRQGDKQAYDRRLNKAKKAVANNQKILEDWQATADYVTKGEFSVHAVRTTKTDKQAGKQYCKAQLEFKHPYKTHTTNIKYTIELTADGEMYVEVGGIDNAYGL